MLMACMSCSTQISISSRSYQLTSQYSWIIASSLSISELSTLLSSILYMCQFLSLFYSHPTLSNSSSLSLIPTSTTPIFDNSSFPFASQFCSPDYALAASALFLSSWLIRILNAPRNSYWAIPVYLSLFQALRIQSLFCLYSTCNLLWSFQAWFRVFYSRAFVDSTFLMFLSNTLSLFIPYSKSPERESQSSSNFFLSSLRALTFKPEPLFSCNCLWFLPSKSRCQPSSPWISLARASHMRFMAVFYLRHSSMSMANLCRCPLKLSMSALIYMMVVLSRSDFDLCSLSALSLSPFKSEYLSSRILIWSLSCRNSISKFLSGKSSALRVDMTMSFCSFSIRQSSLALIAGSEYSRCLEYINDSLQIQPLNFIVLQGYTPNVNQQQCKPTQGPRSLCDVVAYFSQPVSKEQIILYMNTGDTQDLGREVVRFYRNQTNKKRSATISSATRVTIASRPKNEVFKVPDGNPEQLESFFKNQRHLAFESPGLEFKELPGNLKIHFNRPPSPPPNLEAVPYTHEIVPMQPVKVPKRKRGEMADWVFEEMGWKAGGPNPKKNESGKLEQRSKSLVKDRSGNPSIYEIVKREMKSKPYQHYNSIEFFKYVKDGNLQEVQFSLKETPTLAVDFDEQRMTPLHWAARQGHSEIVKILCQKYKAPVNAQDSYGRTPIYLASENRRNQAIYRLFVQGGDIMTQTTNRKTAKDVAPDLYTKYALEKIEEIKKILETRRVPASQWKETLESQIRATLDPSSAYF